MQIGLPAIRLATWAADEPHLRSVRTKVFVVEQAIREALDFDGKDPACLHALAISQKHPVATGRMEPDGHIGRVAVVEAWRHRGFGTAIVRFLVARAKERGLDRVYLNGQQQALRFYQRLGFSPCGEPFMEAGIVHIRMEKNTEP
jgi:predicted GNAT family N-acyltransferase